jgi:hypothetical protein
MQSILSRLPPLCITVILILVTLLLVRESIQSPLYTWQPQATQTTGEILAGKAVGQSFVAEYAGLSAIEVKIATNSHSQISSLIFHLRTDKNSEDLITLQVLAPDIKNGAYHIFDFPKIHRSAGQKFYFYIESPEREGYETIEVWGSEQNTYDNGKALLDDQPTQRIQDLTFRATYEPALRGRLGLLIARLSLSKPLLWGNETTYAYLIVSYGVALHLAIVYLVRQSRLMEK